MAGLLERLGSGEILIGDGAMGTLLMDRGLELGACPEAFNLDRPEVLREIAGLYLEAGADVISTNTFGGSALKLEAYGLDQRTEEINRIAVAAVREVVGDRALVAASCGPCGRILKPYGDVAEQEVYQSFARQVKGQIEAGADAICVETMTDLNEARLAIQAIKDNDPAMPTIATMTFDPTPRGYFTVMGVTVEKAAAGLAEAGANIIGSNCGNGVDRMVEIAGEFRAHTDLPLIIQSNAGLPENRAGEVVYPESPDFMAERVQALVDHGVGIIGGCCGTTPAHIRKIREAVRRASV